MSKPANEPPKDGDVTAVNLKDEPPKADPPKDEPPKACECGKPDCQLCTNVHNSDDPPKEDPPKDEPPADDDDDMVAKALRENEALKKQLEDIRNNDANVFEQNEALKAELASQEKLLKIAKENEELQQQLDGIKRKSLIDSLITRGSLNNELKDWAGRLPMKDLEEFASHAPKVKTILDQTNEHLTKADQDMEAWRKQQQKSRIIV